MNQATNQQVYIRTLTATELITRIRECEKIINNPRISALVRSIYQQYRDRLWLLLTERFEAQLSDSAFMFIFQIDASFTLNLK